MVEWLKILIKNLSISDIIAVVATIISIIAAIVGWVKSAMNAKKAKAAAEMAAQYAENADESAKAAKQYYDMKVAQLQHKDSKEKMMIILSDNNGYSGQEIMDMIKYPEQETIRLLKELHKDGRIEPSDLSCDPNDPIECVWLIKRKR